jgi:hypothetical protein
VNIIMSVIWKPSIFLKNKDSTLVPWIWTFLVELLISDLWISLIHFLPKGWKLNFLTFRASVLGLLMK